MSSLKPHGGSSGDVSKIEPALQDTVVAAIASLGIAVNMCASRNPRQQQPLPAMQCQKRVRGPPPRMPRRL